MESTTYLLKMKVGKDIAIFSCEITREFQEMLVRPDLAQINGFNYSRYLAGMVCSTLRSKICHGR